jgi:REP element-mobilizing transposase RayT
VYFVTICAHREFVAAMGRRPFEGSMAALIEERLRITEEKCPQMRWGEWVIMPDHFHALIHMKKGDLRLGDVVGGFKAAVSREWRRMQEEEGENIGARQGLRARQASGAGQAPRRTGEACLGPRIWHRNFYERIVRDAEAERKIARYIRMNPWRCVQELDEGLRGIGNPALWNGEKLGVLCSRGVRATSMSPLPDADVYFSGWHSPKEKEILDWLLANGRRVIACPAWGIEKSAYDPSFLRALEENRMLLLEMRDVSGNLAAAEARNRFVIEKADALFTPHVSPGGMLERLLQEHKP